MTGSLRSSVASIHVEDGILVYEYFDGAVVNDEAASETMELGRSLVDSPLPTLVLMKKVRRVSQGARSLFSSKDNQAISRTVALVVGSPISRVIGNFFLGLDRGNFPTRIFNDRKAATDWLRT